jgi:ketosteroid isomerase-like protein
VRGVVVTPVQFSGPPRASRNLEERLMVRFPGAWRAFAALTARLFSPRSRLRRTLLRRSLISAYAAASRRDFELMLVRYAPDVEFEYDPDFEAVGLGGTFHGHGGMIKMLQTWGEAWERWDVQPAAVLDLGGRFVVLGHVRLPGTASGLELEREFAQLLTVRAGVVAQEREFLAWDKGLRAAGLDPGAITLPVR